MADLKTQYMGLTLSNPIIVGSSGFTTKPSTARQLEAAGAAALVMKSVFEEEIRHEQAEVYDSLAGYPHPEAQGYLLADYPSLVGAQKYLERLEAIKKAVKIPVFASINCVSSDNWMAYAKQLEAAGADGIELNIYDIAPAPGEDSNAVEAKQLEIIEQIKGYVSCPVSVKLAPFYSTLVGFARRAEDAGADALVLFNRFFQPDIDIDKMELVSGINFTQPEDIQLPLRWMALLRPHLTCDLALTTGVHTAEGLIKALLAGASAVQVASVIYRSGMESLGEILKGLEAWMDEKGFESIADFQGKLANPKDEKAFARVQYIKSFVGVE